MDIGDKLIIPSDVEYTFFIPIGNDMRIIRVLSRLLNRLDESTRFDLLKNNFEKSKSISVMSIFYIVMVQQHGEFGSTEKSPERILNHNNLEKLGKILLNNIREVSSE